MSELIDWRIRWEEAYFDVLQACQRQGKIHHNFLAQVILNREKIITLEDTKELLLYNKATGLYEPGEGKLSWCIQFCAASDTKINLVKETIETIKRITIQPREKIGQNVNLIPLANGIYNFKTKEFMDYNPEFVFTSKHPINYLVEEDLLFENPIDKFLGEVTEKQEDAVFLKEFIGYMFYRQMPFHTFVILVGAGANGKSVFLNIIREMVGTENISERTLQELAEDRFASADLFGKNVNIVGDLPRKALQDTGLLKRATGGDVVPAQKKYQQAFKFKPYAKIICAANEAPESPDMSFGFLRRTQIINFPNTFEGKENRNLTQELCTPTNLSHFFLSCINAFSMALEDNKWVITENITQKEEKYVNYSNSALAFANTFLEYEPDSELPTQEIYERYKVFCVEKKLIKRIDRIFFVDLFRFFQNRVYKKRRVLSYGLIGEGHEVRQYVIVGVAWK